MSIRLCMHVPQSSFVTRRSTNLTRKLLLSPPHSTATNNLKASGRNIVNTTAAFMQQVLASHRLMHLALKISMVSVAGLALNPPDKYFNSTNSCSFPLVRRSPFHHGGKPSNCSKYGIITARCKSHCIILFTCTHWVHPQLELSCSRHPVLRLPPYN